MAGISEEWEDRANEGDGAFATAVAIRELTQEVRRALLCLRCTGAMGTRS